MLKYFFDLHEDAKSFINDEGLDFNDEEAARIEAQSFLERFGAREDPLHWRSAYLRRRRQERGWQVTLLRSLSYAGVRLSD